MERPLTERRFAEQRWTERRSSSASGCFEEFRWFRFSLSFYLEAFFHSDIQKGWKDKAGRGRREAKKKKEMRRKEKADDTEEM